MRKNEMNAKSTTRKPLKEVSNHVVRSSKAVSQNKKKKSPDNVDDDHRVGEDDTLDRLLLVHSDLSSIIHQIDELVVQAFKVKVASKKERKEIESFTQVLSEIHSSLKPWAPRFQKALSFHSIGSEDKLGQQQSLVTGTVPPVNEDTSDEVQSPEQTKVDSLVSPSPLVSWRADCTTEGGRQLFLLTPMPRPKPFQSKLQTSSKLDSLVSPSPLVIKPTPNKVSHSIVTKRESTLEAGFVSPPKFSKKECSMLVMTPCLKMSPPRSCVLLEPISELSHKDNHEFRKSTPYPVRTQDFSGSQTSESSSSEASENLALKYPELFGIQPHHKFGNGRKGVEASPDWLMSPPKTCVLMEPPEEKSLTYAASFSQFSRTACLQNQQNYMSSVKRNDVRSDHHLTRKFCIQEFGGSSALIESTPMLKEPESTFRTGKRPGENTLKKELWTKFEAASSHGTHFNFSVLQDTAQKGFLDRLEEVSCDETKSSA